MFDLSRKDRRVAQICDFLKVGLWHLSLSSAHVSTEAGMSGHTNRLDTDCWKVARWGIQCLPTPGRRLLRQMYQDSSIQQAMPISHCLTHTLLRSHLVPSEGQSAHILLTWAFSYWIFIDLLRATSQQFGECTTVCELVSLLLRTAGRKARCGSTIDTVLVYCVLIPPPSAVPKGRHYVAPPHFREEAVGAPSPWLAQ